MQDGRSHKISFGEGSVEKRDFERPAMPAGVSTDAYSATRISDHRTRYTWHYQLAAARPNGASSQPRRYKVHGR